MGTLAGFTSDEVTFKCRATVSRSMPNSRAMRRCDQPRPCSDNIVSIMATLSRLDIVDSPKVAGDPGS